jgi:RNA-directed DNA polymerase
LISKLNPIIRGWANYYQHSDIKTVGESGQQDYLTYLKLRRWAKRRCKNKSSVGYAKYWHKRSYTLLNGEKSMRVEFSTGPKPEDTDLAKHGDIECSSNKYVKVKGDRSYYDGDFIYWGTRLGKHPETSTRVATLLKKQKGKCTKCGHYFTSEEVIEVDHIIPKSLGGKDEYKNLQLLHGHCHDTKTKEDNIREREKKEELSSPELKRLKTELDTVEMEIKRRKGLKLSEVNKTQIERLKLVKTDLIKEIKSVRKEMKSSRVNQKPKPKPNKAKVKEARKPDHLDLIVIERERQQLEERLKVKLP